jgi:3-oxoacyl-[acyl-carrier-protein] synthase II
MGHGWAENAAGFRAGRLALRPISLFDASRQRVDRAGEVLMPNSLPDNLLSAASRRRLERGSELLLHACLEAWAQAGLRPGAWPDKQIPIALGTSAGAMAVGEALFKQSVQSPGNHRGQAKRVRQYQIPSQAKLLREALGIDGPVTIISNACASGANCIGHAFEQLRYGRADVAVAAGYDALSEMVFAGFDSLQALSTDIPRPFDAHRDGLALGEGAGAFILETYEHALARGAEILGEICGYGAATDLHHLTQPHPQGSAAVMSMTRACASAGITPAQIGYINSHGTGTPLNDVAEANAIVTWAGETVANNIAVSSTKAAIGHLLGAAGSVEAVICLMALREGWLPPTPTIRELDPVCKFDVVQTPRDQAINFALTNSFGFGGANATLVLGRGNLASTSAQENSVNASAIVISGIGAVSGAGWTAAAIALTDNIPAQATTRTSGALTVNTVPVPPPTHPLPFAREARLRRVSPISRYAISAALEALGETRRAQVLAGELRLGVVFSILNGCVNYSRRFYTEVLADPHTASPILFPETVFNAPASHLSALLGSPEISYTVIGDRSNFLSAMNLGCDWLREGKVDGVLVVAAEEQDWLCGEAAALYDPQLKVGEGGAAVYLEMPQQPTSGDIQMDGQLVSQSFNGTVSRQSATLSVVDDLLPAEFICTSLTGSPRTDADELAALVATSANIISPLRNLGSGLGVSSAWQVVAAVSAMQQSNVSSAIVLSLGNLLAAHGLRLTKH